MKIKFITLIAIGLVFFSSCSTEEIDPELRVFVTTKASEKYEEVDLRVNYIRITAGANDVISTIYQPTPLGYTAGLKSDKTTLLNVVDHFESDDVSGIAMNISIPILYEGETLHQDVEVPWFKTNELNTSIDFENGKDYRIDFTIDFDEHIYEENGVLKLNPEFAPVVTEL